jgi:hypothetical protein
MSAASDVPSTHGRDILLMLVAAGALRRRPHRHRLPAPKGPRHAWFHGAEQGRTIGRDCPKRFMNKQEH